jgi:hypothetical protein
MAFSTLGYDLEFNSVAVGNIINMSISGRTAEALDNTEITDNTSKFISGRYNEGTLSVTVRPTDNAAAVTLRGMAGNGPSLVQVTDGAATPADLIKVYGTMTDISGPDLDGAGLAEMTLTFQLEPDQTP